MLPNNPPREPLNARNILNPTFYSRKRAERRVKKQAATAKDVADRVVLSPDSHLPPGTFLGENASFLHKDGYEFFRRRALKYNSPVFITHLFAEPCIAITGAEEAKLFFDENYCIRTNANAPHLTKYFFGRGTTSGLDGSAHIARKAQVMANFTPDKLETYIAIWARTLDKYALRWAMASQHGPLRLREELFTLHTEFAMAYVLGIFDPTHEAVNIRRRQIVHVIESFGAVPHLRVPGSRIWRVNKSRRSLQSWLLSLVEQQRRGERPDGTILAAVAKTRHEDGELISAEMASAELLNLIRPTVIGAYLTTWMMAALHDFPQVLSRLRNDVNQLMSEMPADDYYGNKAWLDQLAYGEAIANEVRRFYPCVPLMMGRVRRTFEYNGMIFPQGWSLILGIHGVHRDPRVYSQPDAFMPERFEAGEHKRTVDERFTVLQQSGSDLYTNHKCAGETLTTLMMKSLAARVARDFDWTWTTGQKTGYKITDLPPTPADGVLIEGFRPRVSSTSTGKSTLLGHTTTCTQAAMAPMAEPAPIGMMSAGGFATRPGKCPMGYDAHNQPSLVAKADDEKLLASPGVCPVTGATAPLPAGVSSVSAM